MILNKPERDDFDHITATIIFYLTHLFKLKNMNNKEYIDNSLLLQDSVNITLYANLYTIYLSEKP
jgi:hypothetical protein